MNSTPTPWAQTKGYPRKITSSGILICTAVLRNKGTTKQNKNGKGEAEAEANARRIVAAVNATADFTTTDLEQGVVRELVEAAEKLSDAERGYRLCHDMKGDGHIETGRAWDYMRKCGDNLRNALTKIGAK